jgi:RNA polymerase sigma-70 factor, ECF subfamily
MISRRSVQGLTFPVNCADNPELPVTMGETSEAASRDDTELIALLHARDSGHLDVLFDRYSRLVLGTASHVLGDPSEAEEVVQEVFLYLYRKSELFDPSKGSLKAWISRITFSRALDRKLYLARRRFYAGADISSVELPGQTDLDQEIETKLSRKELESAFTELTAMQRRTIELFYFEDLELREIGEQLRQPLGRVRHHLYRGLERLRKSPVLHRLRCNRQSCK